MKRGRRLETAAPFAFYGILELVDLPIAGDLRGRGHWRLNLDLRSLHVRQLAGALTFGDPRIVRLVNFCSAS